MCVDALRLILKLWAWAAPPDSETAPEQPDEADFEARRVLDELTALHARRCYFALIKLIPSQVHTDTFPTDTSRRAACSILILINTVPQISDCLGYLEQIIII